MRNLNLCIIGLCLAAGGGCSSSLTDPVSEPGTRFYSYVDAQGNLVTLAEAPGEPGAPQPPDGPPREDILVLDGEVYLTPEALEARQEARDRNRFVTWQDPDGRTVTEKVDLVAARQGTREPDPGYRHVGEKVAFAETWTSVPADCCPLPAEPEVLRADDERVVRFAPRPDDLLYMPEPHPAKVLRLGKGVRVIGLQTFVEGGAALLPQLLFLDAAGAPLLLAGNVFTRDYPETWSRLARLEGEVERPEEARWLVLFLSGAEASGTEPPAASPAGQGPRLVPVARGELVVRGRPFVHADAL